MTRKELQDLKRRIRENKYLTKTETDYIIRALEQEPVYFPPCVDCNTKMNEIREAYDKLKNQEPCEDAISRQAVLDMMHIKMSDKELYMAIYELPSVNPQPKTGHWIKISSTDMYCSECNEMEHLDTSRKFCAYCGTRMVESQESEEE